MRRVFTTEMTEWFVVNYPHLGSARCAKHLGITMRQAKSKAREMKLQMTEDGKRLAASDGWKGRVRNYRVAPEQFLCVSTPEVAYLLGFLWADGYLSRSCAHPIGFEIATVDFEEIWPIFLRTGSWCRHDRTREGRGRQSMGRTNNRPIYEFLIGKGYAAKSSVSACAIVEHVPAHLRRYWFRGLVDGDGHIAKSTVEIASSYKQDWTYMIAICNEFNLAYRIRHYISKKGHKGSTFTISRKAGARIFLDWIYEGFETDRIGFSRKHLAYKVLCEVKTTGRWQLPAGYHPAPAQPPVPNAIFPKSLVVAKT